MKSAGDVSEIEASLLGQIRDDWIRIGLNTQPADRAAAEAAIAEAYRRAGYAEPLFLWQGSPFGLAVARAFKLIRPNSPQWDRIWAGLRRYADVSDWRRLREEVDGTLGQSGDVHPGPLVTDAVHDAVQDQVRAEVQSRVCPDMWDRIAAEVAAPLRRRIRAAVWASVGRGLWASVQASAATNVWGGFRASMRDAIRQSVPGQHDANRLGFYDALAKGAGDAGAVRPLRPLMRAAKSAGWWLPHENICWISERPRAVALDEAGVLHAASGPAVVYPDGWSLHAWRGTLVPRDWIERPHTLTSRTALTHPAIEQRRAACEILGWETVLAALDARMVERDDDPSIGELIEADLPEIGRERFLRVLCGTGRRFALPVPPDMTTALQANAWTYGLDPCSFHPEVRT